MDNPNFIETYCGLSFTPLSPDLAKINIFDIAHALSNQCRFSGHTKEFYSVAEHCVRVSELLQRRGESNEVVLWGLLHDASEAYLVDIPAPLKRSSKFCAYREAERQLMLLVCDRFGLDTKEPAAVKLADMALLSTEARDLMPFRPEHWGALTEDALSEIIIPLTPFEAKRRFLERFAELNGG